MTARSAEQTLATLKAVEPDLRAQGMCGLYLFGSHARRDAVGGSDIDLMFDVDADAHFTLFDQARIAHQLGEMLGATVDLVPRRALHPLVRHEAEAQGITIFA